MKQLKLTLAGHTFMKLMYLMKKTTMEVSGYGLSKRDNMFYVHDFRMPKQIGTGAHTELTQDGIAEHFDKCLAEGLEPIEFGRIWVHTHPKGVNSPSGTDENTMRDTFGNCDWAIMLILTQGEHFHCELWTKKIGGIALGEHLRLPMAVQVDWAAIQGIDTPAWDTEFTTNFTEQTYTYTRTKYNWQTGLWDDDGGQKKTENTALESLDAKDRRELVSQIEDANTKGLLDEHTRTIALQDLREGVPVWQVRRDVENMIQLKGQYPRLSNDQFNLVGELQLAFDCKEITQHELDDAIKLVSEGKQLPPKIQAIIYGAPKAGEADKDQLYALMLSGEIDEDWYNAEMAHLTRHGSLSATARAMIQLRTENPYLLE